MHTLIEKLQRRKNLNRETESLLIEAYDYATRTDHVKSKIDNTPEKGKFRLRGDRDEIDNHMIHGSGKMVKSNTIAGMTG